MRPKPIFAKAHVVKVLTTTAPVQHEIDEWHEPHGSLQSVAHQDPACPGVILHARLGASGLQLLRLVSPDPAHGDNIAVCLPLEALFALAAEINPAFNAPLDKTLPAADLAALAPPAPEAPAS